MTRRRKDRSKSAAAHPVAPAPVAPLHRPRVQAALLCGLYALSAVALIGPYAPHPAMLAYATLLGLLLVALSVVDLQQYRLPDSLNALLLATGLATAAIGGPERLAWSAVAAVAGFAALWLVARGYRHVRGRAGLGLGDAKLLGAGGSHLGIEALPSVLLIAAAAALLTVLVAKFAGRTVTPGDVIAFGPFLAFAIWIVWLVGPIAL